MPSTSTSTSKKKPPTVLSSQKRATTPDAKRPQTATPQRQRIPDKPTQDFTTLSKSAHSLGFKTKPDGSYEADPTKNDTGFQDNRIKFLQQTPAKLKAIIDNLDEGTKSKLAHLRNETNNKLMVVWPRIKGSSDSDTPTIGGKRTRRARPSSNKTKHRRRNQYKR